MGHMLLLVVGFLFLLSDRHSFDECQRQQAIAAQRCFDDPHRQEPIIQPLFQTISKAESPLSFLETKRPRKPPQGESRDRDVRSAHGTDLLDPRCPGLSSMGLGLPITAAPTPSCLIGRRPMGLITKPKPPLDQHAVAHLRVLGFSTSSIAKRLKVPVSEIYDVYQDATYQQLEVRAEEELFQQLHGRQWRLAFQTLSAIERLLKSRDRAYVTAGVHHALEICRLLIPRNRDGGVCRWTKPASRQQN